MMIACGGEIKIPVLPNFDFPVLHGERMSWFQLEEVAEQGLSARDVVVGKELINHLRVNFAAHCRIRKDRLDLGAEGKKTVGNIVIERLDANSVSGQEK